MLKIAFLFCTLLLHLVTADVGHNPGCPRNQSTCNSGNGNWACCPFPNATCCEDQRSCCPENEICDLDRNMCTTKPKATVPMTLLTVNRRIPSSGDLSVSNKEVEMDNKIIPFRPRQVKPKLGLKLKKIRSKSGNNNVTRLEGDGCGVFSCFPCFWCTCCIDTGVEALCCPVPAGTCCEGKLTCCVPGFKCCDDQIHCCPYGTECKKNDHGQFEKCE